MVKPFRYLINGGLLLSLWACMEIRPIAPPLTIGANRSCQAPPIEQNIIGTWHFESTFNLYAAQFDTTTRGTITFTTQKQIIDPDSLFENHLQIGNIFPVTAKTYAPDVASRSPDSYSGRVFEVYLVTKKGIQIYYFIVVSNECNKIHMRLWQSGNNGIGFVLTRV